MRVLYLSRDYSPHDHRMLSAILAGGHEAFFLRLEDSGRQLEQRPVPEQVQRPAWRGGKARFHWHHLPALALSFKEVLADVKPDLVHAGPIQDAGLVAVLSGFHPLVCMSWGFDLLQDADRSPFSRWVTRNVLARADWLFADCRSVLDKAQSFGYPLHRSTSFPWGVDLRHFSPGPGDELRQRLGWQEADVLLCNRSWEPRYGVDLVAQAFVQASRSVPSLRLVLLGGGSQADRIRRILSEGGVADRVHLGGQVPNLELPDWYRAADLYLSASHTDGSSVSLMEALACGLPAAVSDIPANQEWITPGEQGWLFPDGSMEGLSALMAKAHTARVDLAVMRLKARQQAQEKADWEKNRGLLWAGYESAAGFQRNRTSDGGGA